MAALDYGGTHNLMRFPGFKYKAVTVGCDVNLREYIKRTKNFLGSRLRGTLYLDLGSETNLNNLFFDDEIFVRLAKTEAEIAACYDCDDIQDKFSDDTFISDLIKRRIFLERRFDKIVKGAAVATVKNLDCVCSEIVSKCGFRYAETVKQTEKFDLPKDWFDWAPTATNENLKLLELVEEFLSANESKYFWFNEPKLFCYREHGVLSYDEESLKRVRKLEERIGNKDDIWYATHGEIFEYVRAFERLEFSSDGTFVYNPNAIDVYIKYIGNKNIVVPSGKTIDLR